MHSARMHTRMQILGNGTMKMWIVCKINNVWETLTFVTNCFTPLYKFYFCLIMGVACTFHEVKQNHSCIQTHIVLVKKRYDALKNS